MEKFKDKKNAWETQAVFLSWLSYSVTRVLGDIGISIPFALRDR
jgi:hypothetical protein